MTTTDDATIGRLVAEASRDLSALIQAEVKLAKSELSFSAKAGGIGTAMFLVAGYLLWTGMLENGPQTVTVIEHLAHRELTATGRELVSAILEVTQQRG